MQRAGAADVEPQVQQVSGMQQAAGGHGPGLAEVAAFNAEGARHVEQSGPGAERRQGLQPEPHGADFEGHRQAAGRRPLGREARTPEHPHGLGGGVVDAQAPEDQLGVAPVQPHAIGLEPHALLVGDGQAPDGEIAPDVAAQPLDLQLADAAELQAAAARLQHHPPLRRQHAEAKRGNGGGDDEHHGDEARDRPAGGRARAPGPDPSARSAARGRRGRVGQNACPMLM